jgi:type II secretory ATPase GspE/PulE/Tfp pilus assembly ATPase PilB-like protein
VAQRLGRRLDPEQSVLAPIPDAVRHRLHPHELEMFPGGMAMHPRTTGAGATSGYRGRLGFYELLMISGPLREGVGERRPAHELLKLAGAAHVTMRRDGLRKAAEGHTSIDEVLRATQDTDDIA